LGIQVHIEILAFLLGQMMGDLDPDHGVIDADKKIKKIAQVGFVGNGAFEKIIPVLGRIGEYFHILRAYRRVHRFTGRCG